MTNVNEKPIIFGLNIPRLLVVLAVAAFGILTGVVWFWITMAVVAAVLWIALKEPQNVIGKSIDQTFHKLFGSSNGAENG